MSIRPIYDENATLAEVAEREGDYKEAARLYLRAAKNADKKSVFKYFMAKNMECSYKVQVLEWAGEL